MPQEIGLLTILFCHGDSWPSRLVSCIIRQCRGVRLSEILIPCLTVRSPKFRPGHRRGLSSQLIPASH